MMVAQAAAVQEVEYWCAAVGSPGTFLLQEQGDEYVVKEDTTKGTVLLSLPGDIAATLTDVEQDEEL